MRLGIAMSGGVDSALAAALLLEQGHEVHGYFMELPLPRTQERWHCVEALARRLDIPLSRCDLRQPFRVLVTDPFVTALSRGRTPNPCVVCNAAVKFGLLLERMLADGMEAMATGHYVRLGRDRGGAPCLRQALDRGKDQSYFLCRVPARQLPLLHFPLGDLHKEDVRRRAAMLSLEPAPESQDVCFLEQMTAAELVASSGKEAIAGSIVTADGRELGRHRGIHRYTIGQRRGLGVPAALPLYVQRLDSSTGQVIVGSNAELFSRRLWLRQLDWRGPPLPWHGHVRLRSRQRECSAWLHPYDGRGWPVECDSPQRAVTPGQYAVLYDGELLLGSGEIAGTQPPETDDGWDRS